MHVDEGRRGLVREVFAGLDLQKRIQPAIISDFLNIFVEFPDFPPDIVPYRDMRDKLQFQLDDGADHHQQQLSQKFLGNTDRTLNGKDNDVFVVDHVPTHVTTV